MDTSSAPAGERKHLLTVSVEDYFQSGSLESVVYPRHWNRIESRLEKSIQQTIDLLGEHDIKATFFVLGFIAHNQPEIVRLIRSAGHEIASRGWGKGRAPSPQAFREELQRTREALESAGSNRIYGYRHWRWLTRPEETWILDELAHQGYAYDSSVNPILRRFADDRRWYAAHERKRPEAARPIWEFPVSTANLLGQRIPISGGNYLRQLPHRLMSQAVAQWDRSQQAPLLFYFFPWEIDQGQPHIQGISLLQHLRHYRRIGKPMHVLRKYFKKYRFEPIGDRLGLPWRTAPIETAARRPIETHSPEPEPLPDALPVTLVVPLYNEEANVSYLRGNLVALRRHLGPKYRIHMNLVDDGSSDSTWTRLNEMFADSKDCRLLRHEQNSGVAAAILTGIRNAPTEIVASIDCDGSYDPNNLLRMLPLIESADLVTASPYHPEGQVINVPPWRLFLSRTLSRMYSSLLKGTIHTYTSCFRVYRKAAVETLPVRTGGFLGVAELLIRLRLRGGRIVEFPAILERRLFGESKMKILRTILKHLGLLRELAGLRIRGAVPEPPAPPESAPSAPGGAPARQAVAVEPTAVKQP